MKRNKNIKGCAFQARDQDSKCLFLKNISPFFLTFRQSQKIEQTCWTASTSRNKPILDRVFACILICIDVDSSRTKLLLLLKLFFPVKHTQQSPSLSTQAIHQYIPILTNSTYKKKNHHIYNKNTNSSKEWVQPSTLKPTARWRTCPVAAVAANKSEAPSSS